MEQSFDQKFSYERNIKESFEYKNAIKNGSFAQQKEQILKAATQESQLKQSQAPNISQEQKASLEQKKIIVNKPHHHSR